jgi:galactonate dehydratase
VSPFGDPLPFGFAASVHMSFSQPNPFIQESVRAFYTGWYEELVTKTPTIRDGYVYPTEGSGLGLDLRPRVFERSDLISRRSEA